MPILPDFGALLQQVIAGVLASLISAYITHLIKK
jgi:hypothetical protein